MKTEWKFGKYKNIVLFLDEESTKKKPDLHYALIDFSVQEYFGNQVRFLGLKDGSSGEAIICHTDPLVNATIYIYQVIEDFELTPIAANLEELIFILTSIEEIWKGEEDIILKKTPEREKKYNTLFDELKTKSPTIDTDFWNEYGFSSWFLWSI